MAESGLERARMETAGAVSAQDYPRKVYLEVTSACNLRCNMCPRHTWDETPASMPPDIFHRLLDQLRAMPSVEVVQFGGFGEPLTHPDIMEFVREVKQTGLRAELVTNGVLLDRRAAETLLELQLDKLAVSLDGLTPQPEEPFHVEAATLVHDHLRLFHQLKQARRSQRPDITLVFVASRRNIDQLPRLQQAAQEFGATNILVTNLLPPTRELNDDVLYQQWATTRRTAPQAPWNPAIDLPRMDLSSASQVIERLGTAGNHVRLGGATVSGGRMYCRFVHEGCVAVSPVGDVSPCLPLLHSHRYFFRHEERRILAYHPGNINRASLQDIWDSDHFRAFRERVRRFEFSPTCCSRRSPCVDRLLSSSWLCSPAPVRPTARQAT